MKASWQSCFSTFFFKMYLFDRIKLETLLRQLQSTNNQLLPLSRLSVLCRFSLETMLTGGFLFRCVCLYVCVVSVQRQKDELATA